MRTDDVLKGAETEDGIILIGLKKGLVGAETEDGMTRRLESEG